MCRSSSLFVLLCIEQMWSAPDATVDSLAASSAAYDHHERSGMAPSHSNDKLSFKLIAT